MICHKTYRTYYYYTFYLYNNPKPNRHVYNRLAIDEDFKRYYTQSNTTKVNVYIKGLGLTTYQLCMQC